MASNFEQQEAVIIANAHRAPSSCFSSGPINVTVLCSAASCADAKAWSAGYMQVTHLQETEWLADVNQMLRDEDDLSYSVRTSACLFLDEVLSGFSATLFGFLGEDVNRWCQEAAHQKVIMILLYFTNAVRCVPS